MQTERCRCTVGPTKCSAWNIGDDGLCDYCREFCHEKVEER